MKSLFLNGRMALKRKTACFLTILFAAIATVFLLVYPVFIESTRAEMEFAYDSIQVSGWILNGRGYNDPELRGDLWHPIVDSGYISEHYTYSAMDIYWADPWVLEDKLKETDPIADQEAVFQELMETQFRNMNSAQLLGLNAPQANNDLFRQLDQVQWQAGWSADRFFSGAEQVCLVPESMGYGIGGRLPFRMSNIKKMTGVFWLEVVGTYPIRLSGGDVVLPLRVQEELCLSREDWIFWVNGCTFLVKDNRQLDPLKDIVLELGLDGKNTMTNARVAIDDRILDGTVSPIKSNLAMLEGLYKFFFLVVAAIGFFLCFLLARGRRQEYAVMRLLGESSFQVTWKAILEQFLLSLLGIVLGAGVLAAVGQGRPDLVTCGVILACYTLGAAVAVILTVRVNVMEILRDKE